MTYAEIIAAVKAYSDRYDTDVDNQISTFIIFSEARINRRLRIREMSTRYSIPTVTDKAEDQYALPTDFLAIRNIFLLNSTDKQTMTLITPQEINDAQALSGLGGGYYYAIIENMLQISPKQDTGSTIEMAYYQRVPPLTSINTTNWMSLIHPDVYLSAMMGEVEAFLKNKEGADAWFNRCKIAINEIDLSAAEDTWSGPVLAMRTG